MFGEAGLPSSPHGILLLEVTNCQRNDSLLHKNCECFLFHVKHWMVLGARGGSDIFPPRWRLVCRIHTPEFGICMFAHSNPQTEITERNIYVTRGVCSPPPQALGRSHSRCTAGTFLPAGAERKLIARRFSQDHSRKLAARLTPRITCGGKSRERHPEFQAKPLVIAGPVASIAKNI